jgi:hypothetical protein
MLYYMYSIFRYMPTTILTEQQKNYVFMLLAGGDMPENEIRMFLARSGWSLDQIDAGVLYSRDTSVMQMLREVRAPQGTAIKVETPVTTTAVPTTLSYQAPSGPVGQVGVTESQQAAQVAPSSTPKIDPYRESAEAASVDFRQAVIGNTLNTPVTPAAPIQTAQTTAPLLQGVPAQDMRAGLPPVRTMPPVPKQSSAHGVLVFFAWLLFFILIGLIAAIIGYMYYTNSGLFENITYTKLF